MPATPLEHAGDTTCDESINEFSDPGNVEIETKPRLYNERRNWNVYSKSGRK